MGKIGDVEGFYERVGDGFLGINVLSRRDRAGQQIGPHLRRPGIEKYSVVGSLQSGIEIGRGARDAMRRGECRHFFGVAADKNRVGHDAIAIGERDAALIANGHDRADEMLVQPHAPGDAVHNDAKSASRHL